MQARRGSAAARAQAGAGLRALFRYGGSWFSCNCLLRIQGPMSKASRAPCATGLPSPCLRAAGPNFRSARPFGRATSGVQPLAVCIVSLSAARTHPRICCCSHKTRSASTWALGAAHWSLSRLRAPASAPGAALGLSASFSASPPPAEPTAQHLAPAALVASAQTSPSSSARWNKCANGPVT